jgi:hypothetical protein
MEQRAPCVRHPASKGADSNLFVFSATDFASHLSTPVASAAFTATNIATPVGSPMSTLLQEKASMGCLRHGAALNSDMLQE